MEPAHNLEEIVATLLNSDPRPTFAARIPQSPTSTEVVVSFMNAALRANPDLHDIVGNLSSSDGICEFKVWINGVYDPEKTSQTSSFIFRGVVWTRAVLSPHAIISSNQQETSITTAASPSRSRRNSLPLSLRVDESSGLISDVKQLEAVWELVPFGICVSDEEGNVTYANKAWYDLTGIPLKTQVSAAGFLSRVVNEDQHIVSNAFKEVQRAGRTTIEFRIEKVDGSPLPQPIGSSPSLEKTGLDFCSPGPRHRHMYSIMSSKDGGHPKVLACLNDITLHKRVAEEAVQRAQQAENLKQMAESASVAMFELEVDGRRLIWANDAFYQMCGLRKSDSTNPLIDPFRICVADEDLVVVEEAMTKLITTSNQQTIEVRLKTHLSKDESTEASAVEGSATIPRWTIFTSMPEKLSNGAIETVIGSLTDMSLQRWRLEAEKELERQRKEEALESKRQQENFLDVTSHELRNPLGSIVQCEEAIVTSVKTALEMLPDPGSAVEEAGLTEIRQLLSDSVDHAETIDMCASHQRRLVDDILTKSKMDSDLLSVTPTTVDPLIVTRQAKKMFELEARRMEIQLTMDVLKSYTELGIEFFDLDPSRLRQILANLLTNAVKFTRAQSTRAVSLTVGASKNQPMSDKVKFLPPSEDLPVSPEPPSTAPSMYLQFEVRDTGKGLTEAESNSLFQRFAQGSTKTHVKYGGSGLGLYISRRLAEMHGGRIGLTSAPGKGSTFAFYIQAHIPTDSAVREAREARLPKPAKEGAALSDALIEGVLLVDDEFLIRSVTHRGLAKRNIPVRMAENGQDAIDQIMNSNRASGTFPLSIVLMDIQMPVMDGIACTKRIRSMEKDGSLKPPRIPILAVSGDAREEGRDEAKEAGCDDLMVKPLSVAKLVDKMKELILHGQENDEKNL